MKKILIAGENSYIGNSFKNYIADFQSNYIVNTINTHNFKSNAFDFSQYDTVLCVCGMAHQKETSQNKSLYYKVNRDLVFEIAKKAKQDGVKQFIFLSSMSVFGKSTGEITPDTKPIPKSNYGKSKLEAEELLITLDCDNFKVLILRPPIVYGKNCKGNFQNVLKLLKFSPVFPKIKNKRSMIYIENLCEFIRISVDENKHGVYYPQNKEYVSTSNMAYILSKELNQKIYFSRTLGLAIFIIKPFINIANKAFGNLIYKGTERDDFKYCIVSKNDSFKKSV